MTDITPLLPETSKTVEAIYEVYKQRGDAEQERQYLGMSEVAGPCERALWYKFRKCCKPNFSGRLYRLFETGDLEESRFIKDLKDIGCEVYDRDENGGQFAFSLLGGHLSGHMDGCAKGIPEAPKAFHVLEFKTSNNKLFEKLKKEGVKKVKPQHFGQMMLYMMASGMTRALYLAKNKDNEELYGERIRFDKEIADALMARAERIIKSTTPPERISSRQDYYECSYCDAKEICWGTEGSALPIPAINCRQCCHATPTMDGKACWKCEKHNRGLSESDQSKVCDDHLVLPGLISFAVPVNAGSDFIEFNTVHPLQTHSNTGISWRHGKDGFTTQELMILPPCDLTNPMLQKTKEVFGCKAVSAGQDILARYPESDSEIVWRGPVGLLSQVWYEKYGSKLESLTPIEKCEHDDYRAAEFSDGRVTILWMQKEFGQQIAEIRCGKE